MPRLLSLYKKVSFSACFQGLDCLQLWHSQNSEEGSGDPFFEDLGDKLKHHKALIFSFISFLNISFHIHSQNLCLSFGVVWEVRNSVK